jgi:GNAT superfamily N-acetyltransferase
VTAFTRAVRVTVHRRSVERALARREATKRTRRVSASVRLRKSVPGPLGPRRALVSSPEAGAFRSMRRDDSTQTYAGNPRRNGSASRALELSDGRPALDRVGEIRVLERADLPEAAALFELVMGSGARVPKPTLVDLFERTLLETPWADPELPSLVALDGSGRMIGFIGAEVRRMRFRGRSVRAVWSQHLVVDPAARRLGVGGILLRQILKGAQDMTFTDSASETVRAMWPKLGGQTLHLKGIHWVRVFRPCGLAAHMLAARARPRLRASIWRPAVVLDAVTTALAGRYLAPPAVQDGGAELGPRGLLEILPEIAGRLSLYPDYDQPFLEWLFTELLTVERRGRLVARRAEDTSGHVLGWYVYYLRPGWRSEVLQVAARRRDVGRVLDDLFSHACRHGAAALRGRLEPGLVEALMQRRCLLRYRGGALVHARDPELLCAVDSESSLITRLEGEWWGDVFV